MANNNSGGGLMEQDWINDPRPNYDGTRYGSGVSQYGGAAQDKPWYNNATWAGALKGSVDGIFSYLNMQEKLRGEKSLMADQNAYQTGAVNASVQRASTMPLLQRLTKKKAKV
jgi:hypothetical protein